MSKDTFAGFHPTVNLIYFSVVIGFAMFFTHPVCLGLSLLCAMTYSIYVNGKKAIRFNLLYMLPMLLFTALLNPAFNHQGATILTYLPDGNPLTLESILYGFAAAVMLITVISWFSCFNEVMTSDKLVYLFGRLIPALSLVLSMSLRFVPRFRDQIKVISSAQKCVGRDVSNGNLIQKAKHGIKILSIMVTWALENAIETADSMNGRGYGLPGRTAFSIFRFDRRDARALIYILVCASIAMVGSVTGVYRFRYFPTVKGEWTGAAALLVFIVYFALCAFPILINIKEDLLWKSIKSKT
ncbi:MAG: energy-coupling factor transporter transmembrane protein EcfT [Peptococcaceae bacterium]|jgi:energy-coupling factor transport system permease protein|nr:energy-coupling factor transporter transmembrane protein EcfT [Peptococcaceae bacterium]